MTESEEQGEFWAVSKCNYVYSYIYLLMSIDYADPWRLLKKF